MKTRLIIFAFIIMTGIGMAGYVYWDAGQSNPQKKRIVRLENNPIAQAQATKISTKLMGIQRQFDRLLTQGIPPQEIELHQNGHHQKPCETGNPCLFAKKYDTPRLNDQDAPIILYQHLNDQKYYISALSPQNKQILIQLQNVNKDICRAYNQKYGFSSIITADNGDTVFGENTDYAGQWTFCHETNKNTGFYQIVFALYAA